MDWRGLPSPKGFAPYFPQNSYQGMTLDPLSAAVMQTGAPQGVAGVVGSMAKDLAMLPARAGQVAVNYGNPLDGTYNAAPIMESALTAITGGMPFAQAGALGSAGGRGIGGRLSQPPLGAQPARELAPTEVLGEIGKGAPPINLQTGTLDAALQAAGVKFRKDYSSSLGSPSQYFYIETPSGAKKIRVSDHPYGQDQALDLRLGAPSEDQLQSVYRLIGLEYPTGAAKAAEIARLEGNISRWPDSPAVDKWRAQMSNILQKYGIAGMLGMGSASQLPPPQSTAPIFASQ